MEEAILIIENDRKDFYLLKNELTNFICIPAEHSEYPDNLFKSYQDFPGFICKMINLYHDKIKTIIIDISLSSESDIWGIDLIEFIRHSDDFSFPLADEWKTLIPIFCFTRHGTDDNIKRSAYEKGATNYFSKTTLDGTGELLLMKQNILLQKHLFNRTMKYSFNDIQTASELLLVTSKDLNRLTKRLTSSNIDTIQETIKTLITSLNEKSQLINSNIEGVTILIEKESKKAAQISKLMIVMNLIMLEESKRELFCEHFANELYKLLKSKDYELIDQTFAIEKKHMISKILKSPSIQGLSFLNNLMTFYSRFETGISEDGFLTLVSKSMVSILNNI